jgi:hypothetical protein
MCYNIHFSASCVNETPSDRYSHFYFYFYPILEIREGGADDPKQHNRAENERKASGLTLANKEAVPPCCQKVPYIITS